MNEPMLICSDHRIDDKLRKKIILTRNYRISQTVPHRKPGATAKNNFCKCFPKILITYTKTIKHFN